MINVERITDMCWDKRTTIAGLERTLGFSNGAIAKWKTSNPSVDKVKKVADFFGCSVDELLLPDDGDSRCQD
jgi:transcriptional regulator with XRE-family HTH domain